MILGKYHKGPTLRLTQKEEQLDKWYEHFHHLKESMLIEQPSLSIVAHQNRRRPHVGVPPLLMPDARRDTCRRATSSGRGQSLCTELVRRPNSLPGVHWQSAMGHARHLGCLVDLERHRG